MRKSVLVSVIVLALAGLLVSLTRPDVSASSSTAASYALSASARSCPHTPSGGGRTSMVAIASVPSSIVSDAQPATGRNIARLNTIGATTTHLLALASAQQQAARWKVATGQPASLAIGTGSLAAGLATSTWTLQIAGRSRGLMSTDCVQPRADYWFVGGGSSVGRTSQLILSNPDPTAAQTTVTLSAGNGPEPFPA